MCDSITNEPCSSYQGLNWTANAGFLAFQSGVSIGTLVHPPTGNIFYVSGNSAFQGDVFVSGNIYSNQTSSSAGGIYLSIQTPFTPPSYYGNIPQPNTLTYSLDAYSFIKQGKSSVISVSNGYFVFSENGIYNIRTVFQTDYNNILGLGIGHGTRGDQVYVYSYIPNISQNPTEYYDIQLYCQSGLYYYIDLFAVGSSILQTNSSIYILRTIKI